MHELISLTKDTIEQQSCEEGSSSTSNNVVDSEFALFMSEMEKEGVLTKGNSESKDASINEELKALEGSKCRAPHRHQWGDVVYHNAMICSVSTNEEQNGSDFDVS